MQVRKMLSLRALTICHCRARGAGLGLVHLVLARTAENAGIFRGELDSPRLLKKMNLLIQAVVLDRSDRLGPIKIIMLALCYNDNNKN